MAGEPSENVQTGFRQPKWTNDQLNGLCEKNEDSRRNAEGNHVPNRDQEKLVSKQYNIAAVKIRGNGRNKHIKQLCCLKPY